MSRKGKMPIILPKGVEIKVSGNVVSVKGPKGTLTGTLAEGITLEIKPDVVHVKAKDATRQLSRFHGLLRSLVQNMIIGVTTGFDKQLEMVGVGYRAAIQGNLLDLQIGFSHPTRIDIPKGLQVKVEKNTAISITGIDKQVVGEFAAKIRAIRPPEPYQGKGIRYSGEVVRKKAGKAAKAVK
jgi:large subunit ribosomal protein L6